MTKRNVRIVNIGSELLKGFVKNTNDQFIIDKIAKLSGNVIETRIIPDQPEQITRTLKELIKTKDLIITTGGLGPTDDDLTVDILARLSKQKTIDSINSRKKVEKLAARLRRENRQSVYGNLQGGSGKTEAQRAERLEARLERIFRQCRIPEKAIELPNKAGLAPGIYLPELHIVSLPGFPLEIESIWPYIEKIVLPREHILIGFAKNIPIWGISESTLFEEFHPPAGVEMGVHSLPWGNRLFLSATEEKTAEGEQLFRKITRKYKHHITDNPVDQWVNFLHKTNTTFGTIESCTGGLGGKLITDREGVSSVFKGSLVTYANEAKQNLAGVSLKTLKSNGAVSYQTAAEMVTGALKALEVDYAISITGIAGPTGGSPDKPVGTVYIGIKGKKEKLPVVGHFNFPFGRERFRDATIYTAFLALYQRYIVFKGNDFEWSKSTLGSRFIY